MIATLLVGVRAEAQSAYFSGSQTTLDSGLNAPLGVTADSAGNVFIADSGGGQIIKESRAADGTLQKTIIASGLSNPSSLAVDSNGNVYIADAYNAQVLKESPNGTAYTQSVVDSGLEYPKSVAVDASGDVYVADAAAKVIYKETLSGGSYARSIVSSGLSYTPVAIAIDVSGNLYVVGNDIRKETLSATGYTETVLPITGLLSPEGIAVDPAGIIYLTDYGLGRVVKAVPSGQTYIQSYLGSKLAGVSGIAADGLGNVYVTAPQSVRELQTAGVDYGSEPLAKTHAAIAISFTFSTEGAIQKPQVVSMGDSDGSFVDAQTGTCNTGANGKSFAVASTCTVNVKFAPKTAGSSYGSVQLTNSSGAILATAYLFGVGTGPQVAYGPSTPQQVTASGLSNPIGIATDTSGNFFVADVSNNRVIKETLGSGGYTLTTVGTGLSAPLGVAVDGAGNVYIADSGHGRILVETLVGGAYVQSVAVTGLNDPYAVAVDGSGNLYIADTKNNRILKETLSSGIYVQSLVDSGVGAPRGIAVDSDQNIYVADTANSRILKEVYSASGYTQSVLSKISYSPTGISVDQVNNVYVIGNKQILKETPSGTAYTSSIVSTTGPSSTAGAVIDPAGVSIDPLGNFYITDFSASKVYVDIVSSPSTVVFSAQALGSQTISFTNIGNADLTLTAPNAKTVTNPIISSGFSLGSDSSCPQLFRGSSAISLAAGSSCTYNVLPTNTASNGVLSGTLQLTDNNLNVRASVQTTDLAFISPTSLTFGAISAHIYGDAPFVVDATSASTGVVTYAVTSGPASISGNTVTLTGGGTVILTATQAANVYYPALTAQVTFVVNTPTSALLSVTSAGATIESRTASDTPNSLFIASNGAFFLQNALSQYDTVPTDHYWNFYTGANAQSSDLTLGRDNSVAENTQTMCMTGDPVYQEFYGVAGRVPASGYPYGNYCDVVGVWVDPDTGNWYGLVHNEVYPNSPRMDAINYAISTDSGKTWTLQEPIISSPYGVGDTKGPYYYYGDGDPRLIVDTASGYFYLYYFSRIMTPLTLSGFGDHNWEHVARAPISQKMAPESWQKFYNGSWSQTPGVDWACDPNTTSCAVGLAAASMESNVGADGDPIQNIKMVQPLAAQNANDLSTYPQDAMANMNISWNVYLQKYMAQTIYNQVITFYVADDLALQKWTYAGSIPYPEKGGVGYWWMMDAGNLTSGATIGKNFYSFCTGGCPTSGSEGFPITFSYNASAPAPVYVSGSTGAVSMTGQYAIGHPGSTASTASSSNVWTFTPVGDGFFNVVQGANYLQVADGNAGRAWGAGVTLAAPIAANSTGPELSRQQWFFQKVTGVGGTTPTTNEYRLVNRYSGLALSFSDMSFSTSTVSNAVTAPIRDWDATLGSFTNWTTEQQLLVFFPQ